MSSRHAIVADDAMLGDARPHAPTVADILADPLTRLAVEKWGGGGSGAAAGSFEPAVVERVFREELEGAASAARVTILELSSYLERYLWPHFDAAAASFAHVMSIVALVNEKARSKVPVWDFMGPPADAATAEGFAGLFARVLRAREDVAFTPAHRCAVVLFLITVYASLEHEGLRKSALLIASLPTWRVIAPARVERALVRHPQVRRAYSRLASGVSAAAATAAATDAAAARARVDRALQEGAFAGLIDEFLEVLRALPRAPSEDDMRYICRFMELLVDLLSQLPTRRYLRLLVEDRHVVARCRISPHAAPPAEGQAAAGERGVGVFRQLVDNLSFVYFFAVDDITGVPLSEPQIREALADRVCALQLVAFRRFPERMREIAMASVGALSKRSALKPLLDAASDGELAALAAALGLTAPPAGAAAAAAAGDEDTVMDAGGRLLPRELVLELLLGAHTAGDTLLSDVLALPLYPTEAMLWDPAAVPSGGLGADAVHAMPKLNLQFLSFYDYLLRNFKLYRVESSYQVREDVSAAIAAMAPARAPDGSGAVTFTGASRMALPIMAFEMIEVSRPAVGSEVPASVRADVKINLMGQPAGVRREWDQLREHDVMFLVTIKAPAAAGADAGTGTGAAGVAAAAGGGGKRGGRRDEYGADFPARYGVVCVRGCQVQELFDASMQPLHDTAGLRDGKPFTPFGDARTVRVRLDSAQYRADVTGSDGARIYTSFNVLIRRRPKENNFRAVLDAIRDCMGAASTGVAVPKWLQDTFLGYGDAAAAHYSVLQSQVPEADWADTFLSAEHLLASFPHAHVRLAGASGAPLAPTDARAAPPYRLRITAGAAGGGGGGARDEIVATPYVLPSQGPFPQDQPKRNAVPFTPTQIEAIRSGLNAGLTMIVGPPGTGKTDVAVQIIVNLYRNYPSQRILLIAHSNQALNDLFEKIMARDIPEWHLLRLGTGERDLSTEKDFSKWGRVEYSLERRLALLAEVERLAAALGVPTDFGYTCETADTMYKFHVAPRIVDFEAACAAAAAGAGPAVPCEKFPFSKYFADAPGGLEGVFRRASFADDLESARGCIRHVNRVFEELASYRALELLRASVKRNDYMMTTQARVVAMTCTHAAIMRHRLHELRFHYDSVVMEEAAQVTEIETFIPIALQRDDSARTGAPPILKRLVLIGDHNQLPPVVTNLALQQHSGMEQSLFTRWVRLGTPIVQLDAQGRARPSIARLYNWQYKSLGDLPHCMTGTEFQRANAGLTYDYQLINVEDFNGMGETSPWPHAFQNIGEAQFVISVFQFLRLCGHPADRITILTPYNGQKQLLQDLVEQRCAPFPVFGRPSKVATVDHYQGQQNDIVLLSLVRTRHVGHLRDVRRLVVAMSRARLGLYVFCRQALFQTCYELAPTFQLLTARPNKLHVVLGEPCPTTRKIGEPVASFVVNDVAHMGVFVQQIAHYGMPAMPSGAVPTAALAGMGPAAAHATAAVPPPSKGGAAAAAASPAGAATEAASRGGAPGLPTHSKVLAAAAQVPPAAAAAVPAHRAPTGVAAAATAAAPSAGAAAAATTALAAVVTATEEVAAPAGKRGGAAAKPAAKGRGSRGAAAAADTADVEMADAAPVAADAPLVAPAPPVVDPAAAAPAPGTAAADAKGAGRGRKGAPAAAAVAEQSSPPPPAVVSSPVRPAAVAAAAAKPAVGRKRGAAAAEPEPEVVAPPPEPAKAAAAAAGRRKGGAGAAAAAAAAAAVEPVVEASQPEEAKGGTRRRRGSAEADKADEAAPAPAPAKRARR